MGKASSVTPGTSLWRQVHPSFVDQGIPTTQAFRPTKKDDGKLSVDNGDMINAEQSDRDFTGKGYASTGVLAVTVGECREMDLEVEDNRIDSPPAHALIVLSGLPKGSSRTGQRFNGTRR